MKPHHCNKAIASLYPYPPNETAPALTGAVVNELRANLTYEHRNNSSIPSLPCQVFNIMSQYLSLSAFARELGCSPDEILKLITDKRIKAHQLAGDEPFIRKSELNVVKGMISWEEPATSQEEHIIQTDKDRVIHADSRAKIAAERVKGQTKVEQRRLKLSSGRKIS